MLTLRKSDGLDDWYVIERAEHDGREWMEPTEYGFTFMTSARFSDADVEGTAEEMVVLAKAVETRSKECFKRCAVDATSEPVRFWSPRNSQVDGEVSYEAALKLAQEIRRALTTPANSGEEK